MLKRLNQIYCYSFLIFIKGGIRLSDIEILSRLGLEDYGLVTDKEERNKGIPTKRYLLLTEDSNWTHLIDESPLGIWFSAEIEDRIKKLSKDFEIFTCLVLDYGIEFSYLKAGGYSRKYEFDIEKKVGNKVVANIGIPFPIERVALSKEDDCAKIITMMESFGIEIGQENKHFRVYTRFENERERNAINDDEY